MKRHIPSVFTSANAVCGFLSIIATIEGSYTSAAWLIVLAAVMDAIDGRSARYLGMETIFGKELDALADAISFCVAPAALLYGWYCAWMGIPSLFLIICMSSYVCAGLFRLARFNTLSGDQSYFFVGLPAPMGAFFLVQFIIYQQWIERFFGMMSVTVLGIVVLLLAGLFISQIPFFAFKRISCSVHIVRMYFLGAVALFTCGLIGWAGYPLLLLLTSLYIIANLVRAVVDIRRKKRN